MGAKLKNYELPIINYGVINSCPGGTSAYNSVINKVINITYVTWL